MLNKILALFFKDDSQEDRSNEINKSDIPVRNLAEEQKATSEIRNIGLLTAPFKNFHFGGFRAISNFELQFITDFGEPKSLLAISFLYQEEERVYDVLLHFFDPQSLELSSPGRVFDISLSIKDLTDFAWEDMKFEVGDYEDRSMHFYCAAIEVASVTERPGNRTVNRSDT